MELNPKAVVEVQSGDGEFKRYHGRRVLGREGSKILLPATADVINTFGGIGDSNAHPEVEGQHASSMASVRSEVLNRIAWDSQLGNARASEVDLAQSHWAYTQEHD